MNNFKIYPTSLLSELKDKIGLFSDDLAITGPTGPTGPAGVAGTAGPTGPAGTGGGETALTLTAGENLVAGDIVKLNLSGGVNKFAGLSSVTFEAASTSTISSCYDSGADRIVIAYTDVGNSNFGTAIVGNVTGDAITFGTAVVFESANTSSISCCYDPVADRIVIAYTDIGNSNFGTAIVGNVTGDAITFGTAVVFESATTSFTSCVYDPVEDRVVIAYRGTSNHGRAIVGNVNAAGETITFGTAVVFESATTQFVSCCYNPVADRIVIAYQDVGFNSYGTAIVGNVNAAGETITFGTAVVFESATTSFISCCYNPVADRVVIAYRDFTNSQFGTAIVGNVTGNAITFGTAVVFESASTDYISCVYVADRVVIAYRDIGNSSFGTAIVGNVTGDAITFGTAFTYKEVGVAADASKCVQSANRTVLLHGSTTLGTAAVLPNAYLTDLSAFGIAQETITSGSTGDILISGIDTNQSGLSVGNYYRINHLTGLMEIASKLDTSKIGFATSATNMLVDK